MKITFDVKNQILNRTDRNQVIANSSDFLEAEITFSSEWSAMDKTMTFKNGDLIYTYVLTNDKILKENHLNLGVGTWKVSIIGVAGDQKVVTNECNLSVNASGWIGSPDMPSESIYEQLLVILQSLHTEAASTAVVRSAAAKYIQDHYDELVKEAVIIGDVQEAVDILVQDGTLNAMIAEEMPPYAEAAASAQVADWLENNVDPDTGYVIDASLTTALAAADAKATGDEIANTNFALGEVETAETWTWAFDNLMIDGSGNTSASNYHLLSHPLYHIPAGSTVTIDAGFACTPVVYYSDGTFKQFGTKRTGPYTISFNAANYIRLYIVTDPNGGKISPSDVENKVHASWYLEKFYEKNATKNQLDSSFNSLDTKYGKISRGIPAHGQVTINIDTENKNVEIPAGRLYFDGGYYQANAATLAYGSLGYPAVFYNTQTHDYEIHALDSSLTENTISEHCRFIAYINKTSPWNSSSSLKYMVDGKPQYADFVYYSDTGKNAIFENWSYPKAFRNPGITDKLFIGIVQMNDGKQGVLEYDIQTHNISRHVFNDFSTLDSHNAMAVSIMPGGHILVVGTGHTTSSNIVSYISKKQEDISEFNSRVLIPLPTPVSGMNRATYCQLFYLDGKYHLFTRMTYTPADYSYYIDTWGHSEGTVSTDGEGNESITWSAFKPFITATSQNLKYYAKGAYYTGTKLKFFCQSNYSLGQSDIRLCYLDVTDGSITDDAGNVLGNENVNPVTYTDIPIVISKNTDKLHLNDVLDGAINAIAFSRIANSYPNGQKAFFAIYENGSWNEIELIDQGVPVYGAGTSGPGVTIIDENSIAMAKHWSDHWTIDKYERNGNTFDFTKNLLDSYGSIELFQPVVSANIHKNIICARGIATSYYEMDISTAIIDL